MANTHQVTIGHLSFTSPGTLSYSGGGEGRTYNINGTLAHTSANNLDLNENLYIRDELLSMAAYDHVYPFTYTGERIAGFSPRERYAMQLADKGVGSYQPYFQRAAGLTEQFLEIATLDQLKQTERNVRLNTMYASSEGNDETALRRRLHMFIMFG